MKLTVRDLTMVLVTVIITSSFFTAANIYADKKIPPPKNEIQQPPLPTKGNKQGKSVQMFWKDLVNRRNEFLNTVPPMYIQYTDNATPPTTNVYRLEAFAFDATQLEGLIAKNKHGGGRAQSVIFYIGKDGDFTYLGKQYWNMRLFAIGMDKNGDLLTERLMAKAPPPPNPYEDIYDQADPCPPNGPITPPAKK